jgi:putative hydrolase of HD superfamily
MPRIVREALFEDREKTMKKLVNFLFEVGMLRKTPRTGYQFLGSGQESVADHSLRTTVIGFALAKLTGADWTKVMVMCLFHDLPEARIGDMNYVNRRYSSASPERALQDALEGTGLEQELLPLFEELEEVNSVEASLAQDADQLDLILSLKEELDLGNPYASQWLQHALERLRTETAQKLAQTILETDHTDWWFQGVNPKWWSKGNGRH